MPTNGAQNVACDDQNPCTFDRCDALSCANIDVAYGDVAGQQFCLPDEKVNIFDIFAVLDGFRGVLRDGCQAHNVDLASADGCTTDGLVDIFDIFAVLDAFSGAQVCCSR